jgi:hypothetical protein
MADEDPQGLIESFLNELDAAESMYDLMLIIEDLEEAVFLTDAQNDELDAITAQGGFHNAREDLRHFLETEHFYFNPPMEHGPIEPPNGPAEEIDSDEDPQNVGSGVRHMVF